MDYRCPYCGEPAFSLRIKLGIVSKFGTAPRCPHCKRVCERHASTGGSWGYYLIQSVLALLSVFCLVLAFKFQILELIPIGIVLFVIIYLLFNYLCNHFDKISSKERKSDPVFYFSSSIGQRIWPTVREGEIYIIQFPKEGMSENNSPKVIGLIDKLEKNNDKLLFTIRVIKFQDMDEVKAGEKVRLVTEGMLVVEGFVLEGNSAGPFRESE